MRHLTGYNESAGRPWWQVDEDKIGRHMSGHSLDTFSKAEVNAILDLARGATRGPVWIHEFYFPDKPMNRSRPVTMSIDLLNTRANTLRSYLFAHVSSDSVLDMPRTKIFHPRKSSQQIQIWVDLFSGGYGPGLRPTTEWSVPTAYIVFEILKSTDDYFYVRKMYRIIGHLATAVDLSQFGGPHHYICDGIDGLVSLVRQELGRRATSAHVGPDI